jgi:hypothetical protein
LLIGAAMLHTSNFLLMNVQFYLYPFVFVTFFDMAKVHAAIKARIRLGSLEPVPEEV